MRRPVLFLSFHFVLPLLAAEPTTPVPADKIDPAQAEFFEKKVRPLLLDNCQSCHGPDKQKAGLRLDSREALISGGESGAVVLPGIPDKSRLIVPAHHTEQDPIKQSESTLQ